MNRAQVFLAAYRTCGNVTMAARIAKVDRQMHYRRLRTDPAYKAAFEECEEEAIAVMEDECHRRAVVGWLEPLTFQGRIQYEPDGDKVEPDPDRPGSTRPKLRPCVIRKFSDSNLQFLLRGARPEKYRERHRVDGSIDHTLKFSGDMAELLALYRDLAHGDNSSKPEQTR